MNQSVSQTTTDSEMAKPSGLCEPEKAIERLGGVRSLYGNVVGRFLDDSAGNFAKLRAAVQTADFAAVRSTAHSLKGLAAMCGAESACEMLGALESAVGGNNRDEITALFNRLETEMQTARRILDPFRHANDAP